jgi:hypothetical protein
MWVTKKLFSTRKMRIGQKGIRKENKHINDVHMVNVRTFL